MSDQPKIKRLLQLINLLSGPKKYTVEELADRLSTHPRTVERYCCTLEEAGFVIYRYRHVRHLVKMPKGSALSASGRSLVFSREEADLLNLLIAQLSSDVPLRHNLQLKLRTVCDNIPLTMLVGRTAAVDVVENLAFAIRNHRQVRLIGYASANSGQLSDRVVEPVEFSENNTYLFAFDLNHYEMRSFKLSRIGSVEILKDKWQNEILHKKIHTDPFHMSGPHTEKVTLHLTLRAYDLLIEEYPLAHPYCEPLAAAAPFCYACTLPVCGYHGVGRFVLGLPGEIKVVSDSRFKEYLQEKIKTMLL